MEPQPFPCLSSRRLVGDPVDVVTGANTDLTVDFRLHGPLPLRWRRYYNSARNTVLCPLGWGQTHDYDRTLTYDLDGLRYTDPFGSEVPFPHLEVGEHAVNAGMLLHRTAVKAYELWQAGQPVQDFEFSDSSDTSPLRRLRQRGAEINFRYAVNGRLCEIVDSLGRSTAVESGHDGRILGLFLTDAAEPSKRRALMVYDYDADGNLVAGRDLYHTTIGFRWDPHHRMTDRTDRTGYSFHFAYDAQGRCVHSRGDDGLLEVFLDYKPDQNLTLVRRGDGGQWSYAYDSAGTVTQITDPYGGATCFTMDETGRVSQEVDPNGNITALLYDSMGHHYARLDPLGYILPTYAENPNPPDPLAYELPETALEWEHGRLLRGGEIRRPVVGDPALQDFPSAALHAFLASSAPATEDQASPTKDEQGRPVEQGPSAPLERWKYDPNGNLAEHQDRDGAVYRYVYRSWNALHQEVDPLGHTTVYHHSASQGLVNGVQDPGGTVTEYAYDLKDRLVEVRRHGRVRERYGYDAAANIVDKKDGQGRTLVTWKVGPATLDVQRRLGSGELHTFEYDKRGRIIAAGTPEGSATFAFTEDGERLEDKRDGIGVAHEFDRRQLVSTTCFDKFRTSYQTDDNGDLAIVDPTGACHRVRVSEGGLVAKHLASGARELCLYDAAGRCRRKAVVRDDQCAPPWMRSFTYSRAGDLLSVTDTLQGTVRYRYDQAHRIAEEALPDGSRRPFQYDPAGNLLLQPGLLDVQLASGNRLHTANGDRFTYNDRDHMSAREGADGTTRYEYNELDMLVRCELNGEVWTASYDALCRRVSKTWRSQTTTYYWDDFRLAAEVRHDGSLRVYVYEDNFALAPFLFVEYVALDGDAAAGKRYYVFTNQIGVPIRVEDDEGRSAWSARIDPYGLAKVGRDSTLEMPLRFPGHYYDRETGLHYNRFRYFSPELGRYLQSDPAGLEGGINLYAYPADPLTGADIDGLAKRGGGGSGKPASSRASGTKAEGTPGGAKAGCSLAPPHANIPLNKMSPQQLQDVCRHHADTLAALQEPRPNRRRMNTFSVGVVQDKKGNRRLVATSNLEGASNRRTRDHMDKTGITNEKDAPPRLKKQAVKNSDGTVVRDDKGKAVEQTVDADTGKPYDKRTSKEHHAEQRLQNNPRGDGEHVVAQCPSQPCCQGCQSALGKSDANGNRPLDKIPQDRQTK